MSSEDRFPIINDIEEVSGWSSSQPRIVGQVRPARTARTASRDAGSASVPKQESQESSGAPELKSYLTRWYILFIFSLLACHQCLVWNTFGPIDEMANAAYGWQDSTVAMFANWGTIMFCLSVMPLCWFLEAKGLRVTVVLVSGLVALGTVLRCCTIIINNDTVFLVSCHICAILNGISGVTIMSAPPFISSLWFPISERTTATSINLAANMLGNGIAMTLGPALVNVDNIHNKTSGKNDSSELWTQTQFNVEGMGPGNYSNITVQQIKQEINTYMQLDAGVAVAIFAIILVYFPAKPPLPPAHSSAIERTDFREGLKALITNKDVLLATFCYSISQGIAGTWMGVMVINLKDLGITESNIGFIGLASVLGQCVFSMIVGYFSDRLKRHMKLTLLILLSASTCLFTWLMLMCIGVLHYDLLLLYIVIPLATSINFGCCPLFFEMTAEIAYPVNESLVGGFLTGMYNLVGIIFLFVFFIPNIGSVWMNYALVGSTAAVIPAVLIIKERYNRSQVDELVANHS